MISSVLRVSDILCLMLVVASQKSGTKTFAVRHIDFQRIFKNPIHPLMDEVIFSDHGPEPFSPVLDDSLNHLILSGLTGYPDIQHPEQMLVKSSAFEYARELDKTFSLAEKEQLNRLADKFLFNVKP